MDSPVTNPLPPAQLPAEPQPPFNPPVPPPAPEPPEHNSANRILSLIFLAMLIVAIAADIYVIYLVVSLVVFAYSGGNDPTSVNGLAFPIAIFIDVVVGAPAAAITCLAFFGYRKTRRRLTQATSKRLST